MKIKVCHMTSVHPAKDGRIFHKECRSLANAGYDVTLVAAGASSEECDGVKIVGVPLRSKGRLGRMIKTTRDVYKVALEIDADIYHFHDPELLPYGYKLKKKGKKVIFDSHEFVGKQILTKKYIYKFLRRSISWLYMGYESRVCKSLDAVVEVCTYDGKDYFKNRSTRRVFITNAPILEANKKKNDFLSCELNSEKLRNVVHIGGLVEQRGITSLARAIVKTNANLILAGPFGSKEYEIKIKSICKDKLEYKGILPFTEVPDLLSQCGIGTSTLLDEGQYKHLDTLPTKVYDYMLAGIPIIMSDFPYLKRINDIYDIGLCVSPNNPDKISAAIVYLLSHPDEARKMGENGRKAVEKEFNWANQEKILLALYESLSKL